MDRCIALLTQYKQKHEITLIAPDLNYTCANCTIEVVDDARFGTLVDPNEELLNDIIEKQLFPFLDDTNAIIAPSYPDDFDTVFSNRYFYHGTARAIATTYAKWATREKWLGRSNWECSDLYYSQMLTKEVYEWITTLYNVVVMKCKRTPKASA